MFTFRADFISSIIDSNSLKIGISLSSFSFNFESLNFILFSFSNSFNSIFSFLILYSNWFNLAILAS